MYSPFLESPSSPVNVVVTATGPRTANISWQDGIPPIPGNPPTIAYQVSLNNSRTVNVNAPTTSVSLDMLLPFTNYVVTIVAVNRVGISNSSEPVVFITNEEGKLLPSVPHI